MENKKFGVIGFSSKSCNLGDFVQSIAAKQFLPDQPIFLEREKLNGYHENTVSAIMNGWFMYHPENFPPSEKINPLFTSFHINSDVYQELTSESVLAYFKQHEPIGCRDLNTEKLLKSKGIAAYFSACLTLTLGETYKRDNVTEEILMVDPFYIYPKFSFQKPKRMLSLLGRGRFSELFKRKRFLKKIFDHDFLEAAVNLQQSTLIDTVEEGFELADAYLKRLCNAKLVVTSRIHCALPCLAMGTPVIFLNSKLDNDSYDCRLDGLIDFFNRIDIDAKGKISANFELTTKINTDFSLSNKTLHVSYKDKLIASCTNWVDQLIQR